MELDGAPANLRLFKADMLDYDTVAAAFAGCQGVFHVASPVPEHKIVDPQASTTGSLCCVFYSKSNDRHRTFFFF
jgi:nucleoside-diphosphate-sugar epimerase